MGLNAVVYKNRKNLPPEIAALPLETDSLTGEVYSVDDVRIEPRKVDALHKRLGNIAQIGHLRKILSSGIDVPLLLSAVLQDGSHCGDVISVSQLPELQNELNLIGARPDLSQQEDISIFLQDMTELLQAAQREQNPIVFV
jgi:hypothetical protein